MDPARILVVEDDVTIAGMLGVILRRGGFAPTTVADGRSALRQVEAGEPPAAAVIDVMLPYTDGFTVVAAMRRDPRWSGVPVVMLSARHLPPDDARARELGVEQYLHKPFDAAELLAAVRGAVGQAGG